MPRLSGTRKGAIRKTSRRAYMPKKRTTTRRRRTTKKSMLSELFNPKMASSGAKVVLSGAVGGVGAGLLDKILESNISDEKQRSAILIGAGFLTATMLKMPNVGAGMSGVGTFNLAKSSGYLADHYNWADTQLEKLPIMMKDNGGYLQNNGDYLQDNGYLQDGSMGMQNDQSEYSYGVGYFPEFGQA
tara:strand:+ start:1637 stop:2197 length:561 start_codon:yes stop_codon:yes gene_type:complete